jgi:hypothetical protein
MMIKSHQDIKNYILQLEARFPVDLWKANGIDLWPHIRIKIYYHLIKLLGESTSTSSSVENASNQHRFCKIRDYIKTFLYYLSFQFKLSKKKLIFFGLQSHKIYKDGMWFNRFFDSMIDHHCILQEVYTFELNDVLKPSYNQQNTFDLNLLLKFDSYIMKLKRKLLRSKIQNSELTISNLQEFNRILKKEEWYTDYLDFSETSLNLWSLKIECWESFFKKVFTKTKPKKIIFLSYYGFDSIAAAMSAANKLNIRTVDLQHGPQTNIHMAYCSWSKIPNEGFNTMPKEYWNWDNISKMNLESWWSIKNGVKVIGHPWLAYHMNKIGSRRSVPDNVLYTLQIFDCANLPYFFPNKVIECLKSSNFIWKLRVHPRNENNLEKLVDFLKVNKVNPSGFIIESSKDVSLYKSLSNCILHITNYSGCFIEANMLGIQSVVIDEIGLDMFRDYFDMENNHYLNKNENDFNHSITTLINNSKTKKLNTLDKIWDPLN